MMHAFCAPSVFTCRRIFPGDSVKRNAAYVINSLPPLIYYVLSDIRDVTDAETPTTWRYKSVSNVLVFWNGLHDGAGSRFFLPQKEVKPINQPNPIDHITATPSISQVHVCSCNT
jgi:hypothetical protein